jgi:hypothetical protein
MLLPHILEDNMQRKLIQIALAGALACGAGAATAQDAASAYRDNYTFRPGRAPEWNLAAADGMCRLRIWVDDKARVSLRGDQIIVDTASGKRSFDQGSVCTQPLPFHRVEDFRVSTEHGRGQVFELRQPDRRNDYTGGVTIADPQNGGDTYEIVMSWRNADGPATAPLASNDPYPWFDETRACQDRVRGEFLSRNRDGDVYLEFTGMPTRDDIGRDRERISGEAWARNRRESRPLSYECVLNDRTNRVLSSSYELRGRGRYSALW